MQNLSAKYLPQWRMPLSCYYKYFIWLLFSVSLFLLGVCLCELVAAAAAAKPCAACAGTKLRASTMASPAATAAGDSSRGASAGQQNSQPSEKVNHGIELWYRYWIW